MTERDEDLEIEVWELWEEKKSVMKIFKCEALDGPSSAAGSFGI